MELFYHCFYLRGIFGCGYYFSSFTQEVILKSTPCDIGMKPGAFSVPGLILNYFR
jgi:hypothetical protein